MYELDLVSLRQILCKGVRMIVAIRMLAKQIDKDGEDLAKLEREIREAAGDVQRAEKAAVEDADRPLISG